MSQKEKEKHLVSQERSQSSRGLQSPVLSSGAVALKVLFLATSKFTGDTDWSALKGPLRERDTFPWACYMAQASDRERGEKEEAANFSSLSCYER